MPAGVRTVMMVSAKIVSMATPVKTLAARPRVRLHSRGGCLRVEDITLVAAAGLTGRRSLL
jgi:hypothetical protein